MPIATDAWIVRKRDGRQVEFHTARIADAIRKAFRAELNLAEGQPLDEETEADVERIAAGVAEEIAPLAAAGPVDVEKVQDYAEVALMRSGHYRVARAYITYRAEHAKRRALQPVVVTEDDRETPRLSVTLEDGARVPFDANRVRRRLAEAARGLERDVNVEELTEEVLRSMFDGITPAELDRAMILAARSRIERDPAHDAVAARLMRMVIHNEALGAHKSDPEDLDALYRHQFEHYLIDGVAAGRLDPAVRGFDTPRIAGALRPERDAGFKYLGLQTIYDRYLLHVGGRRIETPQFFWMRVAMGLASAEGADKTDRAIEFYEVLSDFRFTSATPTLFNSATLHPQLSSCYLTTVQDDLGHIFKSVGDNAALSKWAGGLGNDWTNIRATGSHIKGTNGKSQGVIPFLKIVSDAAVAVNQGGKRKGAVCSYLETWHLDIEEFLDLRKNTGDDRRRTHDMHTANWIPDLFMQRMNAGEDWTLFSPDDVPDLHDLYGRAFRERYEHYEALADSGKIALSRRLPAVDLWRKMLTRVFETGHPWVTFKDPSNIRSPQDHCGVVHSSNLCCMTADQRVVTDRGLVTVGELFEAGGENLVVGRAGVERASAMVLPRPNAPIVEIQTREGYAHKVTPDHKVWKKDHGWVEAQDLTPGDQIETQQVEGLWGPEDRVEAAFLCGLIAGDGTFGAGTVYVDVWDNALHERVRIEHAVASVIRQAELVPVAAPVPAYAEPQFHLASREDDAFTKLRLGSVSLCRALEALGFTKETKRVVPEFVWRGTRATVSAYLEGLYLADGTTQAGEITTSSLASTDRGFLRDVQILWANFGVKSSLSKMRDAGRATLPDGLGGTAEYPQQALYRLLVTSVKGNRIVEAVARIGAHRDDAAFLSNLETKDGYAQKLWATFTGLKELPNEDAYCLTVDSDEHSWTVNGLVTKNTEILLNTSREETAVCNLGSINLRRHVVEGPDGAPRFDHDLLADTIRTAVRMLDNVVDINFYPTPEAKTANTRHRPVGLGIMGFQDALAALGVSFASDEAVRFADESMERISYEAIRASALLAAERGTYSSYEGSKWDRGLLPIDTLDLLAEERGEAVEVDRDCSLDWSPIRALVAEHGMRNSNVMAIAPTATISTIAGVAQSIEPMYKHLYVKSNLSGDFTQVNIELVKELKDRGLWGADLLEQLKYYDGALTEIADVPDDVKARYLTAFEVDPAWILECAARRQKWIDQGQSLNLYMSAPSGKKLSDMYVDAWKAGLKTTYYLRTLAATQVEKSTVDVNKFGVQPRWMKSKSESGNVAIDRGAPGSPSPGSPSPRGGAPDDTAPLPLAAVQEGAACDPNDPTCEACQ